MNRSILFAAYFDAEDRNRLHVYHDGFVLVVACTPERHRKIRDELLEVWPHLEDARSDDGFLSVFVLEGHVPDNKSEINPTLRELTDGCADHRLDVWDTLEVLTAVALERWQQRLSGS